MFSVLRPFLSANPFETDALVLIEPSVLEVLGRFRQDTGAKPESGGILLGYRRGPHLHIVEATSPFSGDRQSRFAFDRAAQGHRKIALHRWRESNGFIDYLGEWHSHPEMEPRPSSIDISGWRAILKARKNTMLFIVLGNRTNDWYGIGCGAEVRQVLPA
jgi:integrative and conjugative element protein (TIGR02256 family)